MKFEFLVALKYLIPRLRQLSVSIISVISIVVISLVVWLVIVFLSVTDGIEKKWIDELIALNAPIKITPKESYYDSYYFQIDQASAESDYSTKTITEKLNTSKTDPYDPYVDSELPPYFPAPHLNENGEVKDLVKELWNSIHSLPQESIVANEYEVAFGNLRLTLVRDGKSNLVSSQFDQKTTFLSQVSYVATADENNPRFRKMILKPNLKDLRYLFSRLGFTKPVSAEDVDFNQSAFDVENFKQNAQTFLKNVKITHLITPKNGWPIPSALYPKNGSFQGVGIQSNGMIRKVMIPSNVTEIENLKAHLEQMHFQPIAGRVVFDASGIRFLPDQKSSIPIDTHLSISLAPGIMLAAELLIDSLENAQNFSSLKFSIQAPIQETLISGITNGEYLEIGDAEAQTTFNEEPNPSPLWVYNSSKSSIPSNKTFGDGILLSKNFQTNGVCIGDQGYLSFYTSSGGSVQEQRLPIYVAGFYDQGLMPIGSKLIFADPKTVAALRGGINIADKTLGNGIHLRFPKIESTEEIKESLINALKQRDLESYWEVEAYTDYDFAKPLLQQLKSDKTLFTLIAVIILIVACSNIISMLILLVNDKRREIGILQALGASSSNIAIIFGLCGFLTGLISCLIGTVAAILTLSNLQYLIDFLSFIQGHEAFQSAFYGSSLPNELSYESLIFVLIATIIISLLAGVVPAIKASLLKPSQILRGE